MLQVGRFYNQKKNKENRNNSALDILDSSELARNYEITR